MVSRDSGSGAALPRLLLVPLLVAAAMAADGRSGHAEAVTATESRAWAHPTYTRFVLEMSEQVEYRLFALSAPARLVIDVPGLAFQLDRNPFEPHGVGVVANMRYGAFRPGISRLVLDLKGPALVERAFFLAPEGDGATRFVVDLAEADAAAFARFVRESQHDAVAPAAPARILDTEQFQNSALPVVVIDPGHGGIDPGAVGQSGSFEKDVVMDASRHLAERLAATGRYRVVMTRERDIFIGLRERLAFARDAGADLFLSIHADSIGDRRVRGSHVYSLSQTASDAEAEALAAKENKSDIIAGLDLAGYSEDVNTILLDLSQRETNNLSARFADIMVESFHRHGVHSISRPHRQAGFAVLKSPDVPSLLIELGFLSNRDDERMLRTREGRERLIRAIIGATDRHFAILAAAAN